MRMVVSAGDPSGDVRTGELLEELNSISSVSVSGLGGRHMARAGARILFDLDEYSVMGFTEVLTSLGRLRRLRRDMRRHIEDVSPDALLLVDYPGFNIPLARWASKRGIRVIYYISPQLWAWGEGRAARIRESVDLMITLFDFEVDFYRKHGVRARWAGHPLVDSIPEPLEPVLSGRIALLPGSRAQEVGRLLGPMTGAYDILRDRGSVTGARVAVASGVPSEAYGVHLSRKGVEAVPSVREALDGAAAAVVCSGTATLETSMWGVPFVITYRTSWLTYHLARLLVRGVSRIGMANLVAGEDFAEELIQDRATPRNIARGIEPLMVRGEHRDRVLEGTSRVRASLGAPGSSRRAAEMILEETEA